MKKKIFTLAALALVVVAVSSCSVTLRGYNRPWLGNVANHQTAPLKNS